MTPRGILIVAMFTVACLMAAFVAMHRMPRDTPHPVAGQLFPALVGHEQDVASLELTQADGTQVVVKRSADGVWTLPSLDGYPADGDRVRAFIAGLEAMALLEQKTADPARYGDLRLEEPGLKSPEPASPQKPGGAPAAGRVGERVRMLSADGQVMGDAVFGRSAPSLGRSGGGTYVRRETEAPSWLVEGAFNAPSTAIGWTTTMIFPLADFKSIKAATLSAAGHEVVSVSRDKPDSETSTIRPPPADVPDQAKALRLLELPVSLGYEDVRPAPSPLPRPIREAVFDDFAGGHYSLAVIPVGSENYVLASRVGAAGDSQAADAAAAFNRDHAKWLYRLAPYRNDLLMLSAADLGKKAGRARHLHLGPFVGQGSLKPSVLAVLCLLAATAPCAAQNAEQAAPASTSGGTIPVMHTPGEGQAAAPAAVAPSSAPTAPAAADTSGGDATSAVPHITITKPVPESTLAPRPLPHRPGPAEEALRKDADEGLTEQAGKVSDACDATIQARIDWTTVAPRDLQANSPANTCGAALEALQELCANSSSQKRVAAEIRTVVCTGDQPAGPCRTACRHDGV